MTIICALLISSCTIACIPLPQMALLPSAPLTTQVSACYQRSCTEAGWHSLLSMLGSYASWLIMREMLRKPADPLPLHLSLCPTSPLLFPLCSHLLHSGQDPCGKWQQLRLASALASPCTTAAVQCCWGLGMIVARPVCEAIAPMLPLPAPIAACTAGPEGACL